jgi:hypothetical protein
VLRIYDRLNQNTAIQFADFLLDKFPFRVEVIQTDNGSEFQSAFHWHLMDRGIRHIYIKPATPRLNGKVERSHRIDGEEFYRQLQGVVIDDTKLFNDKLAEWEAFYNYHRPHGALGGQTPYERLKQKTTATTPDVNDLRQSYTRTDRVIEPHRVPWECTWTTSHDAACGRSDHPVRAKHRRACRQRVRRRYRRILHVARPRSCHRW